MVARKRSKSSRYRGFQTHGWGAKKKHRGSGNRGGFGNAGTGKRADQKKTAIWKEKYFGKSGFIMHGQKTEISAINIQDLQKNLDKMVSEKKIKKESDKFIIDLNSLGYNKLLGKGIAKSKMHITADFASAGAIEKIEQAGGKVILPNAASSDDSKEESAEE